MAFYEESFAKQVCNQYVRWNGWGPPASEYSILEFCKAKSNSKQETKDFTEILTQWMNGEFQFENPLWLQE